MTTSEFKTIWTRIVGTDNETRNPMGWSDAINALATDSEANVYAVGHVYGNIFDSTSNGSSDAVIAKFDSSGNFQWGKLFGNGTSDMASGVTCDAEGNVYIMAMHGPTWGEDMPGYMGQPFITKLDCDGNLLWQRETPATAGQTSWRLIVDTNQNVYAINCNGTSWLNAFSKDGDLLGSYSYSGYLTDISAFQDRVRVTGYWSAVTSVDFNLSNGFDASTETILSSPGDDVSSSIKFDADGNYYVAGSITAARDTPGTSYVGLNGETGIVGGVYNQDCFLVKYSPDNQLVWTRQFGTEADEYVKGIAIDQRGNVYVGGVENYIATIGIPFLKVFDPNGNLLWTKTWDSTASLGKVNTFTSDNQGFIYAGGEIVGDLNGEASSGNERPDGFLFKFAYVTGTNSDDTLVGSSGADEIYALDGNDTVMAGAGDDMIIGGSGAGDDIYLGGSGADTLKYTSATAGIKVGLTAGKAAACNTAIKDAASIGADRLYSIENIIGGNYDDFLIGSKFNNSINGENGNDRLCGGYGNDTLEGGLGDDRFVFNTTLSLANIDTISDFGEGADRIELSRFTFRALRGSVTADNLVTGTTDSLSTYTFDKNDFLVFNMETGVLSYDADGSGRIAAVAIANVTLVGISNLVYTDFLVV